MNIRVLIAAAVTLGMAGCASFNPYIQHNRSVDTRNERQCTGSSQVTPADDDSENQVEPALSYACRMILRLEAARAQIVGTRSGVAATLFPMAGIIASNTARGINAPTSTALAASGFAGYSAVSTLSQPDRLKAYDAGLTSLNCAVGAYEVAVERANMHLPQKRLLEAIIPVAEAQIKNAKLSHLAEPKTMNWLEGQSKAIDAIKISISNGSVGSYLGTQLSDFTRRTVASVNAQLTSTVPDNTNLAGDTLSYFQGLGVASPPKTSSSQSPKIEEKIKNPSSLDLNEVQETMDRLLLLHESFLQESAKVQNLDLNACRYTDASAIGFQAATAKLMLGPGDTLSGQTITVAEGKTWSTQVTGGIAPYSASFIDTGANQSMSAKIDLTKGVAMLEITATKEAPLGDYRVVVGDASGRYAKGLTIRVVTP